MSGNSNRNTNRHKNKPTPYKKCKVLRKEGFATKTLDIFLLLSENKMVKMLYHKNALGNGLVIK